MERLNWESRQLQKVRNGSAAAQNTETENERGAEGRMDPSTPNLNSPSSHPQTPKQNHVLQNPQVIHRIESAPQLSQRSEPINVAKRSIRSDSASSASSHQERVNPDQSQQEDKKEDSTGQMFTAASLIDAIITHQINRAVSNEKKPTTDIISKLDDSNSSVGSNTNTVPVIGGTVPSPGSGGHPAMEQKSPPYKPHRRYENENSLTPPRYNKKIIIF